MWCVVCLTMQIIKSYPWNIIYIFVYIYVYILYILYQFIKPNTKFVVYCNQNAFKTLYR